MTENNSAERRQFTHGLLKKWNELDIKSAAAPLLHFADEHPIVTLFIGVLAGLAVLPLLLFFTFVMMTLMFTFFGFMLIEGTLLSIATVILTITLFGVFFASLMFTGFIVFVWIAATVSSVGVQKFTQVLQARVPVLASEQALIQMDNPESKKKAS